MTTVEVTDLLATALAAQFDLGERRTVAARELHIAENQTYALTLDAEEKPRFVMRIYRSARHSTDRIHSELAWVEALAEAGVPTARPVRSRAGELTGELVRPGVPPERFAVLEYIPTDDDEPELPETMAALGGAAGRIQAHSRTWIRPAYFDRPVWNIPSTLSAETSWGRWITAPLPEHTRGALHAAREGVLAELPELTSEVGVLQHADLKPANTIWSGGVLHVIDFDDSGVSWPFFDLAASLTGMENLPETPLLVDAWLTGYAERSTVAERDLRSIPSLLMQRRLMIIGWLLAHPEAHVSIDRAVAMADTLDMATRYLGGTLLASVAS